MDYAQEQRNPTKHLVGVTVVILLHVALVYALLHGLGRKVVEIIKQPLETKIIEEIKPPPPPPEVQLPPPPKFVAPPPPYIPPPEVQVNVPPPPNVITATTTTPPPEAPQIAVRAPPVEAQPAPAPAAPVATTAKTACPNYARSMGDAAYPREAAKEGIQRGEAVVRFTVGPGGEIKDITTVSSTNRAFARAAASVVRGFQCIGQGRDVIFEVPFEYRLE